MKSSKTILSPFLWRLLVNFSILLKWTSYWYNVLAKKISDYGSLCQSCQIPRQSIVNWLRAFAIFSFVSYFYEMYCIPLMWRNDSVVRSFPDCLPFEHQQSLYAVKEAQEEAVHVLRTMTYLFTRTNSTPIDIFRRWKPLANEKRISSPEFVQINFISPLATPEKRHHSVNGIW